MKNTVIIAEKPSVAKSIAEIVGATQPHRDQQSGYLEGKGYQVTWAFGHLVGLKTPEQMGYDRNTYPMFPETWETKIKGKMADGKEKVDPVVDKQMKVIDKLFRNADRIIVATDAGREGELIFRYIYEYLGCTTPFSRLWISSLTDEAIRKGLDELQDGHEYDALSDAAHARSEADWLVGFNASKALRVSSGYNGVISLGRVQTPTLGLICQRYLDNKNFKPTPFWQIAAETSKNGTAFTTQSENRYPSEEQAESDLSLVKKACQFHVDKVEKKTTTTKPPLLYDLTALQRAANGKYGLTADETLKIAQKLYESKFISYPRTGSRFIPEDVFRTIPGLLKKLAKHGELGRHAADLEGKKLCHKSVNDSKVTDHHALLPTGEIPKDLKGSESKIYNLICARTIEAFGEDSTADVTSVTLSAAGIIFKSRGSVPKYLGWKAVSGGEIEEDKKKDDEEDASGRLPELTEGEYLPISSAQTVRKEDKPLPIYTDSSLLGEMETCGKKIDDEAMREAMKDVGLGTPATRAGVIEGLLLRKYIVRDAKKLVPTELGLAIWKLVKGRKISDVKTTGEWERDLALIEQGKMPVEKFNTGIRKFVEEILDDITTNCPKLESASAGVQYTCPRCGKPMHSWEKSVACSEKSGGCGLAIWRNVLGKKIPEAAIKKIIDGQETGVIKGFISQKTGKTFDAKLKLNKETWKVALVFADAPAPSAGLDGSLCPCCGERMMEEAYKLSCACGFVLRKEMCGKKLTAAQLKDLLAGKKVQLTGLTGKTGKKFDTCAKVNTEEKKVEFIYNDTKNNKK